MAYTTIDDPTIYFNTKLYTGDGNSTQAVTGVGFQPNWIWIKNRTDGHWHNLNDSVRGAGAGQVLRSNTDASEGGTSGHVSGFDSDGFTVAAGTSDAEEVNTSSDNYVAWNWKAGTSFSNDASATSVGTIDSSGSVSDTAGFSIVIRTGTASAGTIKHGLSTTPKMIITKMRNANENWGIYHVGIGNTKYLKLDVTDAEDSSSGVWNNTTPTASVFSVGSSALVNGSGKTYVDYIFSEVKGYSKFGSYTGNGSDSGRGPYINLGFRPAFFLLKETSGSDNWTMMDTKRLGYNPRNDHLFPNLGNAEYATDRIEMHSNGIKINDSDGSINQSGSTYIYMAFAEAPLVNSNGVPVNAR